jgi:TPR repeat protein
MRRIIIIILVAVALTGCSSIKKTNLSTKPPQEIDKPLSMSPATLSQLEQGKRLFQDGYYKQAMQQLLPLAVDGVAEAQYAVGYMYYYGYGATQDTQSGDFWIRRSAEQGFKPALDALNIMAQQRNKVKVKSPRG